MIMQIYYTCHEESHCFEIQNLIFRMFFPVWCGLSIDFLIIHLAHFSRINRITYESHFDLRFIQSPNRLQLYLRKTRQMRIYKVYNNKLLFVCLICAPWFDPQLSRRLHAPITLASTWGGFKRIPSLHQLSLFLDQYYNEGYGYFKQLCYHAWWPTVTCSYMQMNV